MDRFDVIRVVIDIMEERGYIGNFAISYISGYISIALTINNHSISQCLTMDEIKMCNEPRYKIRLVINDMINQIRGGQTND